jgi:hypothetical protein
MIARLLRASMQRRNCSASSLSRIGSSGVVGIRRIKMIPTIELVDARFAEFGPRDAEQEIGDGLRLARMCILEEILGAVFGSITLWYLVSSISTLA